MKFSRLPAFSVLAVVLSVMFSGSSRGEPPVGESDLRTVAEKSDFKATARHADVVALLDALAKSSSLARRVEMGKTVEGRSIPMLIVADPPIATGDEARAATRAGKLVVLMLGNIHAGEVDGKEALPMIARAVLANANAEVKKDGKPTSHPLLKDLVLVFAPIFNADGNERFAKDHRPGQDGPDEVGIRENASGLDLNRDFIKLEAPETRALIKALNEWDPALVIDTHITDGSWHRYLITYEGPKAPATDAALLTFARDTMMPAIRGEVEKKYGVKSFVYGDFNDEHTKWETYPAQARYGTTYVGLRNRISVLVESYTHAPYKDRVLGTRDFVTACLEYAASNKDAIRKTITQADEAAVKAGNEPTPNSLIAIRSAAKAAPAKSPVAGVVEEMKDGKSLPTKTPKDYECELWTHFEATKTVTRPFAYLLPAGRTDITDVLQRHGIEVEELREDIELDLEAYTIDSMAKSPQVFQGHAVATVNASASPVSRRIAAGTVIVRTGQRLGTLAAYLLEPACEDGLTTWNFFDNDLRMGGEFPVMRLPKPTPMTTGRVRTLSDGPIVKKPITFAEMYESDRPPNFSGSPVGISGWLDDGEHFLQNKDGKLRKVNASTGRSEVFFDPEPMARALGELPTIGAEKARGLADGAVWALNKSRTAAFFTVDNDLYYARADGSKACRLTSTPQAEELASFSPDGEFVAFVRTNNLFVVDVKTQTERQLTTSGAANILNGKADWVYYEEVFNRNWRTYWWSPDSQHLAFYETDNAPVPMFTIVNDLPVTQVVESTKYPRPGEPNPRVRLGIASIGGSVSFADTTGYQPDNSIIANVGWWPDGSAACFYVTDRTQTWMDVCRVSARGGPITKLFRETTKAWVEMLPAPTFLKDGSFLFTSERTGWKHLYHYAANGTLISPVTSGEWEARELKCVDDKEQWVYVSGTKDSHIAPNLYRAKIDGSAIERLTNEPGSHSTDVSPKSGRFVDSWSSRVSPTKIVVRNADGSVLRTLDTNPVYSIEKYTFGISEQFQITMPDGFVVEASWVKPINFDPAKKYPVWFTTYGGPQAPTIRDAWGGGSAWDQAMADAGFVIFHMDPRPASGKGAVSAWTTYKQLGVQEMKDIVDSIKWLKNQPGIDGSRIGMSGYSFGGYLTAYCMTHSDVFAAGIAGGSPTDWRDYDSIYTERFMGTPQDNPEGYDVTSVNKAAKDLKGRLMILHGLIDDNVHMSNSWKLVKALQDAGKQFELMVYPGNRHGVGGRQYQRFQYDFIVRTLGTPTPAPSEELLRKVPVGP